jgi:hypothetical protein
LVAALPGFEISAAPDVTDHQMIEQGPQVALEQHSFERIGRKFFCSLSEELIEQPFELRHVCRLVPVRGSSPHEELNPVSAFNPRDGRSASAGREQAGADGGSRKDSIPKVLGVSAEQRRRFGRAERASQLAGVIVSGILFFDFCCWKQAERRSQYRKHN